MGKRAELNIKESPKELRNLMSYQKSLTKQKRIMALIRFQKDTGETRIELSKYLSEHIRTLERSIANYKHGASEEMLEFKPRRKGSKIITKQIHEGLDKRVNDRKNSFKGYCDAQKWIETTFEKKVKYHRVRSYMIKHFGAKVKSPRKLHIKKDDLLQL
jgi:hypothetical protein